MTNLSFDRQIDEYMVYCRSKQLREKTMASYEQTLRLFERWCKEQIDSRAFENCSGIKDIKLPAGLPPSASIRSAAAPVLRTLHCPSQSQI